MAAEWYNLSGEAALQRAGVSPTGLSKTEAAARLARTGPNELVQTTRISPLRIFLSQFTSVLVIVLVAAAIISGILAFLSGAIEEYYDTVLIVAIVIMNAALGFVQEYRAEKSLQALKALAAPKARVLREGEATLIDARELVPGDIVLLAAGDRVPADGRLLEAAGLRTNEAPMTGESTPVTKTVDPLPGEVFLGDRKNMVFMGTSVDGGRGTALVAATGMATELGKIAGLVQQETKEDTPLTRQLDRLGRQLGLIVLVAAAVIFLVGYLQNPAQMEILFLTAVSLAVAAIPEGLPAVVTICLALGLQRMVKRHALIRRLPAVEALGSATVICSDKTGTLTKGEMNVRAYLVGSKTYDVQGEGFDPAGEILDQGARVDLRAHPDFQEALVCGLLCNDAAVRKEGDRWKVDGDPTEGALIVAAMRAGLRKEDLQAQLPRVAEVAFTSERKKMSTLHAPVSVETVRDVLRIPEETRHERLSELGSAILYVKGAPERILAASTYHLVGGVRTPLTEYDRSQYLFRNQEMATRALRVLGLARREFASSVPPLREESLERDLTFLGLVGMMDAPRRDAIEAIERCKGAGIDVVMITGDHRLTAMAVAREMGILSKGDRALTGEELDKVPEEIFVQDVQQIKVYARVSPEHKMRIVDGWRKKGHVVAMTGDGVNDAPALKRSDLGVAMGITGTDVAKESADMVLTDDNFASIVAAVEEGRGIYENIRKFVAFLLSANAGELLIMLLATLLVLTPDFLPLLFAVQLLWINVVTDGLPALALGVDPYPKDIMNRAPRNPREGVLSREILYVILLVAAALTAGTLGIFLWELQQGGTATQARAAAFTTVVIAELFLVFAIRSPRLSARAMGFFSNPKLVYAVLASAALQLMVLYVPFFYPAFGTGPLPVESWVRILLVSLSVFAVVEAYKAVRRRTARTIPT